MGLLSWFNKFLSLDKVDKLIALLEDKSYAVQMNALEEIGKLDDPRIIEPLLKLLNDKSFAARGDLAKLLGKLGDARAVEPLITLLSDQSYSVKINAMVALSNLGDSRAIAPLIDLLKDDSISYQRVAVKALEKLGWKPKTKIEIELIEAIKLKSATKEKKPEVRNNESENNISILEEKLQTLITMASGDLKQFFSCLCCFAKNPDEELIPAIYAYYNMFLSEDERDKYSSLINNFKESFNSFRDNYQDGDHILMSKVVNYRNYKANNVDAILQLDKSKASIEDELVFIDLEHGFRAYEGDDCWRNAASRIKNCAPVVFEAPEGTFDSKGRNMRAREIGQLIGESGGFKKMQLVAEKVKNAQGIHAAYELSYAWDGVEFQIFWTILC